MSDRSLNTILTLLRTATHGDWSGMSEITSPLSPIEEQYLRDHLAQRLPPKPTPLPQHRECWIVEVTMSEEGARWSACNSHEIYLAQRFTVGEIRKWGLYTHPEPHARLSDIRHVLVSIDYELGSSKGSGSDPPWVHVLRETYARQAWYSDYLDNRETTLEPYVDEARRHGEVGYTVRTPLQWICDWVVAGVGRRSSAVWRDFARRIRMYERGEGFRAL